MSAEIAIGLARWDSGRLSLPRFGYIAYRMRERSRLGHGATKVGLSWGEKMLSGGLSRLIDCLFRLSIAVARLGYPLDHMVLRVFPRFLYRGEAAISGVTSLQRRSYARKLVTA